MGAALGKPAKAGGTLASDSRRSVSQRLERGLKQAKEELISKETWTSPRQEAETGGRCPALLLPTGKRPGICSLCHHPPLACLVYQHRLETTVPRNLQRPDSGGWGGV